MWVLLSKLLVLFIDLKSLVYICVLYLGSTILRPLIIRSLLVLPVGPNSTRTQEVNVQLDRDTRTICSQDCLLQHFLRFVVKINTVQYNHICNFVQLIKESKKSGMTGLRESRSTEQSATYHPHDFCLLSIIRPIQVLRYLQLAHISWLLAYFGMGGYRYLLLARKGF